MTLYVQQRKTMVWSNLCYPLYWLDFILRFPSMLSTQTSKQSAHLTSSQSSKGSSLVTSNNPKDPSKSSSLVPPPTPSNKVKTTPQKLNNSLLDRVMNALNSHKEALLSQVFSLTSPAQMAYCVEHLSLDHSVQAVLYLSQCFETLLSTSLGTSTSPLSKNHTHQQTLRINSVCAWLRIFIALKGESLKQSPSALASLAHFQQSMDALASQYKQILQLKGKLDLLDTRAQMLGIWNELFYLSYIFNSLFYSMYKSLFRLSFSVPLLFSVYYSTWIYVFILLVCIIEYN